METRKIRLEYPLDKVGVPVFSQLAIEFDVQPNVLAADISPQKGGWLLISVTGPAKNVDAALDWVVQNGIKVAAAA
ncbi:MAG: NIL domain-containing protein [Capsulimonadaceae bacterium]|nr:NIL domain-containing protein [Capsulimonadaceae bacterium]